jgi:hypothetical protein
MKNKYHGEIRDYASNAYGSKEDRQQLAKKRKTELILNKGETSAYRDSKNKKIYIAHRGTAQKRDLSADLAIAFGAEKYHPRFKRAKRETKKIEKENPGYKVVHTGHSLGGALAAHTSKKKGESVTFNKGSGLGELVRKRKKNQTDYVNALDPVSFLSKAQRGGKVKTQFSFKKHPHDIRSSTYKQ